MRRVLSSLDPSYAWIGTREGMGLSIRCPRSEDKIHFAANGPHYVTLWFRNPLDGGDPNHDAAPNLYMRTGDLEELGTFTLYQRDSHPLEVHGHWSGYIVEGILYDAVSFGQA